MSSEVTKSSTCIFVDKCCTTTTAVCVQHWTNCLLMLFDICTATNTVYSRMVIFLTASKYEARYPVKLYIRKQSAATYTERHVISVLHTRRAWWSNEETSVAETHSDRHVLWGRVDLSWQSSRCRALCWVRTLRPRCCGSRGVTTHNTITDL